MDDQTIADTAVEKVVNTVYGPMDVALLKMRVGGHDDEDELAEWVEFRLRDDHENGVGKAGELVHRSAHVTLKHLGNAAEAVAAVLG